jgi:hypothetical protein
MKREGLSFHDVVRKFSKERISFKLLYNARSRLDMIDTIHIDKKTLTEGLMAFQYDRGEKLS